MTKIWSSFKLSVRKYHALTDFFSCELHATIESCPCSAGGGNRLSSREIGVRAERSLKPQRFVYYLSHVTHYLVSISNKPYYYCHICFSHTNKALTNYIWQISVTYVTYECIEVANKSGSTSCFSAWETSGSSQWIGQTQALLIIDRSRGMKRVVFNLVPSMICISLSDNALTLTAN